MPARHCALRIVMPVLNEGAALTARLIGLQSLRSQGVELVLVDGGSTDESWARARPWVDRLIASKPGRAAQMNAGAWDTPSSNADALLFLHADTALPLNAHAAIQAALKQHAWGRFDVSLDAPGWRLRMVEAMMNWRSRASGIATGDQAMFVSMDAFMQANGFPEQPLMEDIELSKRLKRISAPACLKLRVRTSARKWLAGGVWRTILLMWRLRLAYFFGAAPEKLAIAYGYKPPQSPAPATIAIFAKAPVPGLAKTRLIPHLGGSHAGTINLGALRAARLQRQFIGQSLHGALQSKLGKVSLWCAPDPSHRRFRSLTQLAQISCSTQSSGDLGQRMGDCARQHFAAPDAPPLLIIGTDCPALSPGHLQAAARALRQHDACLIPAEDGGYVLIGMRRSIPEVFQQIHWSTDRVMQQTREQLTKAKATWLELPVLWDVDKFADFQRMKNLES